MTAPKLVKLVAVDVIYYPNGAQAVAVKFHLDDFDPRETVTVQIPDVAEYVPGEFYKRELPCILAVLEKMDLIDVDAIVVDGYVYIDNQMTQGLGGHLYEKLEKKFPVIGVAKTKFHNNDKTCVEVLRGKSKVPLYVSAIDVRPLLAAVCVQTMHGDFRIPTILKKLDNATRKPV